MERTETMEETVGMELSETIVKLEHVKKAYKGNVLFTDLNFQVQRGESCAIVGANGSGKSVLLKMICGLVRPDDGNVIVRGEKVEDGKFPKDIGVILDNAGFLPNETGLKNLSIIAGILKKVTREELEATMCLVGLNPASQVKVGKYSLGMKQRLAIAQALMEKPSLLILDEPFNAIDPDTVMDFQSLLGRLNKEEGVTLLMTSHRQEDIQGLCKSIYQIDSKSLKSIA
ncbi:ABC transporter ATP-binding protein [uncultured Acetatifactor sp.]|jgi:ABC-2 type transport system ATP-binding protein|uniref:ABC transporter ATP-binding protein n=1 Tax=uncultured Acetatifactor sp. TaxID=1671927 RepID=UPI00262153D5|nr:ABC transporter ATP-binding protein [uncultured Acetatifactor sp.]